jgi:protein-S-isoprenylcysteine O-methyltransferase Ste14
VSRSNAAPTSAPGRKAWSVLGSLVFLLLAPGVVAGLLPGAISQWRIQPWPFAGLALRTIGVILVTGGLIVLLDSFTRFALQGLGTPAPVFPTRHLVVSGWYRLVRNPMHVAVLALILGQALLFASVGVALYGLLIWAAFYVFVKVYEEPVLQRTFGAAYATYCAHVPGWVPRLRSWRQED